MYILFIQYFIVSDHVPWTLAWDMWIGLPEQIPDYKSSIHYN